MKIFIKIILVLFILFLVTPTVVSVINDDANTSYFYNLSEEEENIVNFNELKVVHSESYIFTDIFCTTFNSKQFLLFDESINGIFQMRILLPPPELI